MTIERRAPNTVLLFTGGPRVIDNEHVASEAITPGHLIEPVPAQASDALTYRKNASASEILVLCVALEQSHLNLGVDDAYASGDLVTACYLKTGDIFWGLLPSGQNIQVGEYLQSNGDGTLKSASATTAAANVAKLQSLDNLGAVTSLTRVRVQVIQ